MRKYNEKVAEKTEVIEEAEILNFVEFIQRGDEMWFNFRSATQEVVNGKVMKARTKRTLSRGPKSEMADFPVLLPDGSPTGLSVSFEELASMLESAWLALAKENDG